MSDDVQRFPVIEEEARITKRATETERVSVRTVPEQAEVLLHDQVMRETVAVVRVPIDREVAEAPAIRTEGDVTIVPVVEERAVVVKRLFLVEELHLTRRAVHEDVSIPATLRRTRVEVTREPLDQQEDH